MCIRRCSIFLLFVFGFIPFTTTSRSAVESVSQQEFFNILEDDTCGELSCDTIQFHSNTKFKFPVDPSGLDRYPIHIAIQNDLPLCLQKILYCAEGGLEEDILLQKDNRGWIAVNYALKFLPKMIMSVFPVKSVIYEFANSQGRHSEEETKAADTGDSVDVVDLVDEVDCTYLHPHSHSQTLEEIIQFSLSGITDGYQNTKFLLQLSLRRVYPSGHFDRRYIVMTVIREFLKASDFDLQMGSLFIEEYMKKILENFPDLIDSKGMLELCLLALEVRSYQFLLISKVLRVLNGQDLQALIEAAFHKKHFHLLSLLTAETKASSAKYLKIIEPLLQKEFEFLSKDKEFGVAATDEENAEDAEDAFAFDAVAESQNASSVDGRFNSSSHHTIIESSARFNAADISVVFLRGFPEIDLGFHNQNLIFGLVPIELYMAAHKLPLILGKSFYEDISIEIQVSPFDLLLCYFPKKITSDILPRENYPIIRAMRFVSSDQCMSPLQTKQDAISMLSKAIKPLSLVSEVIESDTNWILYKYSPLAHVPMVTFKQVLTTVIMKQNFRFARQLITNRFDDDGLLFSISTLIQVSQFLHDSKEATELFLDLVHLSFAEPSFDDSKDLHDRILLLHCTQKSSNIDAIVRIVIPRLWYKYKGHLINSYISSSSSSQPSSIFQLLLSNLNNTAANVSLTNHLLYELCRQECIVITQSDLEFLETFQHEKKDFFTQFAIDNMKRRATK